MKTIKVYSDEGHGGKDSGAVGNGYKEKDIVLEISTFFIRELESHKVNTKRTRDNDKAVSLNKRYEDSNSFKADVFVSHHINSYSNTANGVEVLYHPGSKQGKKLAQIVLDELIKTGIFKSRGIKPRPNLAVLRGTAAPAILIEYGFISNKDEIAKVVKNKQQLGQAAARGVLKYLGVKNKPKNTVKERAAKYKVENKKININGIDKIYKTITDKGITFVELRKFVEDMSNEVLYDNKTAKIATKLSKVDVYYKDKVINLERFKLNGMNYVELRNLLENLGYTVKYNEDYKRIYIE